MYRMCHFIIFNFVISPFMQSGKKSRERRITCNYIYLKSSQTPERLSFYLLNLSSQNRSESQSEVSAH